MVAGRSLPLGGHEHRACDWVDLRLLSRRSWAATHCRQLSLGRYLSFLPGSAKISVKFGLACEPEGVEEMCRLNLALSETKQAGRLWGNQIYKELKEIGAVRSKVDPCLYEWCHPAHGRVFILMYFDNLIVAREELGGGCGRQALSVGEG